MTDVVAALRVFGTAPFTAVAAVAVLRVAVGGDAAAAEAAVAALEEQRAIVRVDAEQLVVRKPRVDIGVRAAFVAHYAGVLGRAGALYDDGDACAALAVVDGQRAQLDRLLLDVELPVTTLPALVDNAVQAAAVMALRWTPAQLRRVSLRVLDAATLGDVVVHWHPDDAEDARAHGTAQLSRADQNRVVMWAQARGQPDRALEIAVDYDGDVRDRRVFVWAKQQYVQQLLTTYGRGVEALLVLDNLFELLRHDAAPVPMRLAETHLALGTTHLALRQHDRALDHLESALTMLVTLPHADRPHPLEAAVHAALGHLHRQRSCVDTALRGQREADRVTSREHFARVLAVRLAVVGEQHELTADAHTDLGVALDLVPDEACTAAIEHLERALVLRRHLGTPDDAAQRTAAALKIAQLHQTLGVAHEHQGNYDAALAHFAEALAVQRTVHGGPDVVHDAIALVHSDIAATRVRQREFGLAVDALKEAVRVLEACGGGRTRDLDTAQLLHRIASTYLVAHDGPRALPFIERAHRLRCDHLGSSHPDTVDAFRTLQRTHRAIQSLRNGAGKPSAFTSAAAHVAPASFSTSLSTASLSSARSPASASTSNESIVGSEFTSTDDSEGVLAQVVDRQQQPRHKRSRFDVCAVEPLD